MSQNLGKPDPGEVPGDGGYQVSQFYGPKCEVFKEFLDWYGKNVIPKTKGWLVHVATCEECKNFMLNHRDRTALEQLTTTDQELLDMLETLTKEDQGGQSD